MSKYLDLDDVVADHPIAKAELEKLRAGAHGKLIWQPASTAPKDGTEFQGWFVSHTGSGFWEPSCRYNKEGKLGMWGRVDYDTDGWDYGLGHLTLTHWMPQPEAPTEQEK